MAMTAPAPTPAPMPALAPVERPGGDGVTVEDAEAGLVVDGVEETESLVLSLALLEAEGVIEEDGVAETVTDIYSTVVGTDAVVSTVRAEGV